MTVEGSSKKAKTTKYQRGTASAPEILGEYPAYTQKVDMWAVGCILYELVMRKKAFPSGDYEVVKYATTENLELPLFPFQKAINFFLLSLIRELLSLESQSRPPAKLLIETFSRLPELTSNHSQEKHEWVSVDPELMHIRQINSVFGQFGEVHEVCSTAVRILTIA